MNSLKEIKIIPIILIITAAFTRLLPHPPNFTPIAAIALFSACFLPKKYALIVPVLAMLLSDYVIGFYGITMLFVYGSFILIGILGLLVRKNKNSINLALFGIVSSILFFLITNFGVWLDPISIYPKTLGGLLESYQMGIPFFRMTLLGNLFYIIVLFKGYEVLKLIIKKLLPLNKVAVLV